MNKAWCSTKYDAWQGYMKLLMARDDAYKNNISKQVQMRPETTYNNSGKSSYANFEIGPDLNKPCVQVIKQQVKMHQDDLHEILVKLHIKFI